MSDNAIATVRTTGLALNEGQTVLGERQVRIPTAGKIRPGIMRLTRAAAENPKAIEAYEAGVRAGRDWQTIQRAVKAAMGEKADNSYRPMTPQNVPYFTVRRSDFASPEIADMIMEHYGEDRGEGLHLYRIPVVFPVDSWQAVLPHRLAAYTRSELLYWSRYVGDTRYCYTRGATTYDERSKRYARPFGGRPEVLRDWNEGRCDPEHCPQYQAQPQQCRLTGSLIFHIWKIPGNAVELPTTSFYSLQGMRQQLELMMHMRGRIAGTSNGSPMFYLAKREEEVSMYDISEGKAKRTKQWITVLETTADIGALLTAPEDLDHDDLVEEAVAVLEGSRTPREAHDDIEDAEVVATADDAAPSDLEAQRVLFAEHLRRLKFPWREIESGVQAHFGLGGPVLEDITALRNVCAEFARCDETDEEARKALWQHLRQPALPSDIGDDDVPF